MCLHSGESRLSRATDAGSSLSTNQLTNIMTEDPDYPYDGYGNPKSWNVDHTDDLTHDELVRFGYIPDPNDDDGESDVWDFEGGALPF